MNPKPRHSNPTWPSLVDLWEYMHFLPGIHFWSSLQNWLQQTIGLQFRNFGNFRTRFRSFWAPKCMKVGTKWALNTLWTSKTLRKDTKTTFLCQKWSKFALKFRFCKPMQQTVENGLRCHDAVRNIRRNLPDVSNLGFCVILKSVLERFER